MISKILLPTDGSDHSEKTIHYAIDFAKQVGAAIVVMYAFSPTPSLRRRASFFSEELKSSLEEEAREIVAEVAGMVRDAGISVDALVVEGSPAEAIITAARDSAPDLIIMGARGAGGLPGLPLGSTAEVVVRHSTVPVLVVK